ncbi:hypothetical protein [Azospirillum sp.]|uniref:hypothetical protein n=1 Tax=Azospirillum sp. TaxID=34012 RepID=UPI002D27FE70|nr:hypothetical protein [Azospirillum sp.]HYD65730.1 hypothetical protein [Azospirillum sp.]
MATHDLIQARTAAKSIPAPTGDRPAAGGVSFAVRAAAEFPILASTAFKTLAAGAMLAALRGDAIPPGSAAHSALQCLRLAADGASRDVRAWAAFVTHVGAVSAALHGA